MLSKAVSVISKQRFYKGSSRGFSSTFRQVGQEFDIDSLVLERANEDMMVDQPWTTKPFLPNQPLQMPVFNMIDGQFTGQVCDLDQTNFNLPLRRDIVQKVFHYFTVKNIQLTKRALTKGDVQGSGRKPVPQKGRGAARQGNKRAPQRKQGGVAHGPVPRDLTEKINGKLRIKAQQIILSAKLYEDRIVLIDSEQIDYHKTKYLHEVLKPFLSDRIMFLTGFDQDSNFLKAASNLKNIEVKNPQQFNVREMLWSDLIFMTKDGLTQYEEVLSSRQQNLERNRKVPKQVELPYEQYLPQYNPKSRQDPDYTNIIKPTVEDESLQGDKQVEIFTPSIKQYMEELKNIQNQQSQ